MENCVRISCPNCKNELQIGPDIASGVCLNCGCEFHVVRGGGIIYLMLTKESIEPENSETRNGQEEIQCIAETDSIIKDTLIRKQATITDLEQQQFLSSEKTAEERKISELIRQKKILEERARKVRVGLIIFAAIYMVASYAMLPTVATYNELFINLAIFWFPIIIVIGVLYMRIINRVNKNNKFIDDYIHRLETHREI